MKGGWEYSKIGKLCKTYSGGTPLKNVKEYYQDGTIPWLRSGEVCKKYIDKTEMFITQKGLENSSAKYYPIDTVVVAMYGATAAQVGILKIEATSNQAVCGIIPNSNFQPEFLYYFFSYRKEFLASQAQGGAQPNISQVKIKNLEVPVPPLSEQQSIVDYLDSAFAKIDAMKANAEKALNEAKALFQASLKEMLEPKEKVKWSTIGDLFDTYSGGTPTKSNKEYYEGGSIPWLRSGEVCQKEITETEMFITEKGLKESSAKYYPENTVVVAMYGATAAQVGILRIKSTSNQAVCGILPHNDFLPEFVYYWFSSIEDKLAAQAQGGAQPNISQQKIKKVEIPIYSITEQQSIVATLDSLKSKVDRLQKNYNKISQECDALKQAILRQVFE